MSRHTRLFMLPVLAILAAGLVLVGCGEAAGSGDEAVPTATATPELATPAPTAPATPEPATPATGANGAIPTPMAGLYQGLTFAQAQELTPFRLIEPGELPPAFALDDIKVPVPPEGIEPGTPRQAIFAFRLVEGTTPPSGIQVEQMPHEVSLGGALLEEEEITVEGTPVRRVVQENVGGQRLVIYLWEHEGVFFHLYTLETPEIEEADLEGLIAAFLR